MKRWIKFLDSMDHEVLVNKKLLFFEFVAAALGGIVFGMLFSPRKTLKIGNNNGNTKPVIEKNKENS
ncbi:MAG: hypothetical protein K5770_10385 [Lachnospiraceae bacterium]|nr:hypothetical protein [Lachnospiraceae bacterium]